MATIEVSRLSRYKDTFIYAGPNGPEHALWDAPGEFTADVDGYQYHEVKGHEVGFLDILAVLYFGLGSEHLWWAIARANGLNDPEADMYAGQLLAIPPKSQVVRFTTRSGRAA